MAVSPEGHGHARMARYREPAGHGLPEQRADHVRAGSFAFAADAPGQVTVRTYTMSHQEQYITRSEGHHWRVPRSPSTILRPRHNERQNRRLGVSSIVLASLVACASDGTSNAPTEDREHGACVIGGCASELCSDMPQVSTCIWRASITCFRDAICEPQPDGACGWTPTAELTSCLAAHPD